MVTPLAVTPYIVGHLATPSATTSVVIPVTTAPALNDTLVAVISNAASGGTISGTSDSKGNTWTTSLSSGVSRPLYFGWAINTKGLTTSDTITVTLPSNNARVTVVGIPGSWRPDRQAGNGGTTSPYSQATGVLAVSGEVCIGGFSQSGTTLPTSPSWTLIENFSTGTIITSAYTNAASTASQTWSASNSGSPQFDIGVITFQPGQILSIAGSASAVSLASAGFAGTIVNGTSASVSSSNGALLPGAAYVYPSAGSTDQIWVEILDKNLVSQGPVQFVNINAQLYYNAVGSWTIQVPYTDALWNIMMAGDFFVNVNWRGLFTFGGKCENPGYQDSVPGAAGGGTVGAGAYIVLSGADWLGLIANRICYPSPGAAWNAQTAASSDPVTNVALETAIKHYVANNIGFNAISGRRNTLMTIGANPGRGANVTYSVKFGSGVDLNLLDVIRALINSTGNANAMGVQVVRNPSSHNLTFDVYVPRDLTGKAWFSEQLGNIAAVSFNIVDPTCTDSLVQGSGTSFIQQTAAGRTIWNAVEVFNDSSSETVVANLQTTASDALLQGQAGPIMGITAVDIPFLTFGRDYYLGDIVSVEVRPGAVYSDVVTGVSLTADPTQNPEIQSIPTIGQNASAPSTDQTIIGQLTARIRALEKKLATQ